MPNPLIEETRDMLNERKLEVDRHLQFALALIDSKANRIALVSSEADQRPIFSEYIIDRSLIKTISATGYLLIYNLVESTMTSALHAIHMQLKVDELTFNGLSRTLQKVCIKNLKGAAAETLLNSVQEDLIENILVWQGYDSKKHWNGNIDVQRIRDKARDYGFEVAHVADPAEHIEATLTDIRNKRNELAHGELSFEQCGGDAAIDALIEACRQTHAYLLSVLDGIEDYLEAKSYKAA